MVQETHALSEASELPHADCLGTKRHRASSEEPDDTEDVDDLSLSDFSAPETKLRDRGSKFDKFAKFRKTRKASTHQRLLKKAILSKRVVPDTDSENEVVAKSETASTESQDEDLGTDDVLEGTISPTSDEEEQRFQEEFLVDDISTQAEAERVQQEVAEAMPNTFRMSTYDNLAHYKTVCQSHIMIHL